MATSASITDTAPRGPGKSTVLFYLAVPAGLALFATIANPERVGSVGFLPLLVFNLGESVIPWWITGLATWGAMELLRPWRPHYLWLCLIGVLVGSLISLPYSGWVIHTFSALSGSDTPMVPLDWPMAWRHSGDVALLTAHAAVVWLGANFVFDRVFGIPRFRYDGAPPATRQERQTEPSRAPPPVQSVGILRRLDRALSPDDVLALKAEEHYVRIYAKSGEHMVLYRFSDAVSELTELDLGFQAHRSYWVNRSAIAGLAPDGAKLRLTLSDGTEVPVSARYVGLVRQSVGIGAADV